MDIKLTIASLLVQMNFTWKKKARNSLNILHTLSIRWCDKPLYEICEDVLNTSDIKLTCEIGFAVIAYGALIYHRKMNRAKFNLYCNMLREISSTAGLTLDSIEEWMCLDSCKKSYRHYNDCVDGDFPDVMAFVLSDWYLNKLTGKENPSNKNDALTYFASVIKQAESLVVE